MKLKNTREIWVMSVLYLIQMADFILLGSSLEYKNMVELIISILGSKNSSAHTCSRAK
jgi:hypothetical protein